MRKLLVFALTLALVGSAMAFDLGNERPAKPEINAPINVPNPDRQGGDTILDAVVVELPVVDGSGTTVGYTDDYDEVCPYSGSTSPDVVYSFVAPEDGLIEVDLLGSDYDTKVYVYDADLMLLGCNDDFHPGFVSYLPDVPVMAGGTYYIIVDGYGGDAGNYVINANYQVPCVVECPAGAELEGEPALVDGYQDEYNGGCNSVEFGAPFGQITQGVFCGVAGWYLDNAGGELRDTDWFEVVIPAEGFFEVVADAEQPTFMFELGPQDCDNVGVLQNVGFGGCAEATMTITGTAGSTIWFWVGPQAFTGPVNEYNYVLLSNLTTPVENHSFSDVKALFN